MFEKLLVIVLFVVWFVSLVGVAAQLPQKFVRVANVPCPLCGFRPLRVVTSTRRDVVLAAALTEMKRVEYFLRTLRTTGSQARVVLFLDSAAKDERWLKFFRACDIEPVFVGEQDRVVLSEPKLGRYYFYQQWLREHIGEVDRVIHTDTFDVMFQGDPFFADMNASKLYFTQEPVKLAHSLWTSQWVEQCYGASTIKEYGSRPVSCSGVTAGGAKPFLKYLDVLLGSPNWTSCFGHSLDQAHHNYLWYTGAFAAQGIEIETMGCDSLYLTMHFCCKKGRCNFDEYVSFKNATAPVLVHQYNRWKNLTKHMAEICANDMLALTEDEQPAYVEVLPPLNAVLPVSVRELP